MPQRIVIVGAGFGGAYCAHRLERTLRGIDAEVLLLDRNNYFVFTPLLLEAGTGSVEPRHAVVPIRSYVKRGRFRMAEVTHIDFAAQRVDYRLLIPEPEEADIHYGSVHYDHLVLATGSVTKLPEVPGLHQWGFEMKSLADAVAMRDRAVTMLELASAVDDPELRQELLSFVIVGANFTGAELAGELESFVRSAARSYATIAPDDCKVTLVEMTDRILNVLNPDLSAYALRKLRQRGIDVRLNTTANEVDHDHVVLSGGDIVPARTTIWCAGIEPSPLIAQLDVPVDERGYVLCDCDLRVKGFTNVWAIGDSAVNIDSEGKPYPATAQHAVAQGKHLARNLARVLRGESAEPCDLLGKGTLAALGCRTGVAQVGPVKLSGFAAWWLWRTVYLLKIPTVRRKLRIALEWTIALFFPRDVVQLGVHKPRHRKRAEESAMAELRR